MAPRLGARKERNVDFSAVGTVGRRTGLTVPKGRIDENGMEEITGIFSSPHKPSPLRKGVLAIDVIEEPSDTPKQTRSTRKSARAPSLPRSASPKKTGINGTARRSQGLDLYAPGVDVPLFGPEDMENTPASTPLPHVQKAVQRFSPSPEMFPLRDITPTALSAGSGISQKKGKSRLRAGGDVSSPGQMSASKARDMYEDVVTEVEQATDTSRMDDSYQNIPAVDDETEPLDEGETKADGSLARAASTNAIQSTVEQSETPKANSRRKRKSDVLEHDNQVPASPSSPTAKKPRKIDKRSPFTKPKFAATTASQRPAMKPGKDDRPRRPQKPASEAKPSSVPLSAEREEELDQIVERVKARPGQNRSLYILRRETPADDGMTHTRSGRVSVKPLAYWRNERCVFGGSPAGANLREGARFPLNSIKEIIRTEEVETGASNEHMKKKRRKRKGKARSGNASESESDVENDHEDPNAEDWESAVGIFRGPVSGWDSRHQASLEQEEETDLAYAPASIQTREVPGSTFRYAKLLSTPFFGAGIVDLPPGAVKRTKNSRKMHMAFFVAKGRVTVQIGPIGAEAESRFGVGKGGFWQVPRGNQYSIENELEKPARVFFSQGCELMSGGDD